MLQRPAPRAEPLPPIITTSDGSQTASKAPGEASKAPDSKPAASSRQAVAAALTNKATEAFIRRTLCTNTSYGANATEAQKGRNTPKPIEELLPPLTSSNDVDLQLYAIIAVILKDFVFTWYFKITPNHVFIDEVLKIIAHCTRALEQRLRVVDLESLLLDEVPELFDAHVAAYRVAQSAAARGGPTSESREIYHTLHPHPALAPVPLDTDPSSGLEQRQNETAWRQLLVQGVLAVLLPTEDLENGCLRALVAEIFAEMIIGGGISDKACEGWVLWEAITKIAEVLQPRTRDGKERAEDRSQSTISPSRLERYGLLMSSASDETEPVKLGKTSKTHRYMGPGVRSVSELFWLTLQYGFLAFSAVRAVVLALATASSLQRRSTSGAASMPSPIESGSASQSLPDPHYSPEVSAPAPVPPAQSGFAKRAIISMKLWTCTTHLLDLELRIPWLSGLASLLHIGALNGPMRVGEVDRPLDRLLAHHIRTLLLNPKHIPSTLLAIRAALFPNNSLAAGRPVPSPEEQLAIKHRAAEAILERTPAVIAARLFGAGTREEQLRVIKKRLLDVVGEKYMTKHLVFGLLELFVVRLMPELAEKGVVQSMEERLGSE